MVRSEQHVSELTRVVLANFTDRAPCRRKTRRPPDEAALAEAARLRAEQTGTAGDPEVVDFAHYAAQARPIRTDQTGEP